MQRFLIQDFDFSKKEQLIQDKEISHQISKVLRLEKGSKFIILNGNLEEVEVEILNINKDFILVKVGDSYTNKNEPEKELVLYAALIKKDNFELVVQKAVEIGVKKIVPIISTRTVKLNLNMERMEKIIKEAAEQSGRGFLPKIEAPIKFEDALKDLECETNLFFDVSAKEIKPKPSGNKIGVWIGSEGGWTPEEISLAKENNFVFSSFGKLTYRAETAAIIGCYLGLSL